MIGVIPSFLQHLEVGHAGLNELVVTDSMHERKRIMYERADAFVILPGGLGTLDETMEVLTWSQLKLSDKPVIIVDVNGFWQPLLALIEHTIGAGFTREENRGLYKVVDSPAGVFRRHRQLARTRRRPEGQVAVKAALNRGGPVILCRRPLRNPDPTNILRSTQWRRSK